MMNILIVFINQCIVLIKKQYEELEEFLSNMEQSIDGDTTLKEIEKYIKKYKAKNKILFITFKTKINWHISVNT